VETYHHYRDFGIRYVQLTGTTTVEDCGHTLKEFVGKGEIEGKRLAKKWIDDIKEYRN